MGPGQYFLACLVQGKHTGLAVIANSITVIGVIG